MATGSGKFPEMHPVAGFRLGIASAGIKKPGRKDAVVMEIAPGSAVAAVFTRNAFCAAPVLVCKEHLRKNAPRYLVVNTGNANAGTGEPGLANARLTCNSLAQLAGVTEAEVLPFSTGVIGEPLPVLKLIDALPAALENLSPSNWKTAAEGIMTTDTRPKGASRRKTIGGETVTITGITKGAGMIKPDMATMLAYVATDAKISTDQLQQILVEVNEKSFNRITVDGDTSTNDSVILAATGASSVIIDSTTRLEFQAVLQEVFTELAQAIIRDGEGATKFVSVIVQSAATNDEAKQVAFTVAESPLVKTALAASDPNWGRILAAIGRAGIENLDVSKVDIKLNKISIVENGGRTASYSEQKGQAAMQPENIEILVSLNRGAVTETVWTTDLTYDYVRINAEYRT